MFRSSFSDLYSSPSTSSRQVIAFSSCGFRIHQLIVASQIIHTVQNSSLNFRFIKKKLPSQYLHLKPINISKFQSQNSVCDILLKSALTPIFSLNFQQVIFPFLQLQIYTKNFGVILDLSFALLPISNVTDSSFKMGMKLNYLPLQLSPPDLP